jgi:hypothetical protein
LKQCIEILAATEDAENLYLYPQTDPNADRPIYS